MARTTKKTAPSRRTAAEKPVAMAHPDRPSRVVQVAAGMVGTYTRNGWKPAADVDAADEQQPDGQPQG